MKDFFDANVAYGKVKKTFPGQTAVFCCDLGEAWLFKLKPKEEADNPSFINGYFGTAIDKKSGEMRQYNMLENSSMLSEKTNIASELRSISVFGSFSVWLKKLCKR